MRDGRIYLGLRTVLGWGVIWGLILNVFGSSFFFVKNDSSNSVLEFVPRGILNIHRE
jgi:hypothetical protein